MNFIEAVKLMKEGRKVKDTRSNIVVRLEKTGKFMNDTYDAIYDITPGRVLTDTWEIVEENKTLSDKRELLEDTGKVEIGTEKVPFFGYKEEYIKQSLKEFIDWLGHEDLNLGQTKEEKAKEIFGERLV